MNSKRGQKVHVHGSPRSAADTWARGMEESLCVYLQMAHQRLAARKVKCGNLELVPRSFTIMISEIWSKLLFYFGVGWGVIVPLK